MTDLIRNISGESPDLVAEQLIYDEITGEIGSGRYINQPGFIAFLQDYGIPSELTSLKKPIVFGLKQNNFKEIQVSY